MINLKDIPYPLRLCVEMLRYCVLSNELTNHKRPSELKDMLKPFFTDEQIDESVKLLCGLTDKVNE